MKAPVRCPCSRLFAINGATDAVVVATGTRGCLKEALELHVEGGRANHSWDMDRVSHSYGGLGGIMDVVGGW